MTEFSLKQTPLSNRPTPAPKPKWSATQRKGLHILKASSATIPTLVVSLSARSAGTKARPAEQNTLRAR